MTRTLTAQSVEDYFSYAEGDPEATSARRKMFREWLDSVATPKPTPSDTDLQALRDEFEYRIRTAMAYQHMYARGRGPKDITMATAIQQELDFAMASRAVAALSRAPQPVQVEVSTAKELDALPVGTVLRDHNGDVLELHGNGIRMTGERGEFSYNWVKFPAMILFRPAALGGA